MSDHLGRLLIHPLRHRLLLEYSGEPESPAQIARRLGEPLNLVSYHTHVLLRHGYIELVRTERRRGALTRFYRATVTTALDGDQWEQLPAPIRRSLTLGSLAQATGEARRAALRGGFDDRHAHISRSPLVLDDLGLRAVADCLDAALDELTRIADSCREGATQYELLLLSFEPPRS
jgi:DNA-binding transcriptional ArsR family regulator